MLRTLALRSRLKKLYGGLAYITLFHTPESSFHIVKIKRVGWTTVDIDYYAGDQETWIKSSTIHIADIVELSTVPPVHHFRDMLLYANPDLAAITADLEPPYGFNCESYNEDEWQ